MVIITRAGQIPHILSVHLRIVQRKGVIFMMGNIIVAMTMRMATATVPADLSGAQRRGIGLAEDTGAIRG